MSCSSSDSVKVTVGQGLTLTTIPAADTTVCSGSPVQLRVSGATNYSWSPLTNLSCSTCSDPLDTASNSVSYTVTGTNSNGCSATKQVIVNVSNLVVPGEVSAIRDTICQGTPGNLTLTGNSSNTLQWQSSTDNVNFANAGDTLTKYKTQPLQQTTWYRAIVGTGNCKSISDTQQLYVPPPLVASFNFTQTALNQVILNSDSSTGNIRSYHWDFGDGQTSNDSNPAHIYVKDTTYYVCLTLYDGSNCSYTFCRYTEITDGIPGISAAGNWIIYPDPFTNQLGLIAKQANSPIQSLKMYDVLGRLVINKNLKNETDTNIDVSFLAKGMYFLVIKTANADFIQKLVKQ